MIEDELLKWRFKCGSKEALCRIYEKYQDFLLTLAIALLNDVNTAEDVLHDVFVSFAKSAENFRLRGSLKSYLATCVINRVRDQIKRRVRQPTSLGRAALESAQLNGPEQPVISTEESERLARAMSGLAYEQREAITLHIKAGMKFREIAKLQGVSLNTAQGRYRYGLNKLRSILNGEVKR
ncbi:MAG: RNA polymerase sigma factor [Planctomycetota bacterium]|jgi:RNA polymerase sigma-70 factor (ECF subfamily)